MNPILKTLPPVEEAPLTPLQEAVHNAITQTVIAVGKAALQGVIDSFQLEPGAFEAKVINTLQALPTDVRTTAFFQKMLPAINPQVNTLLTPQLGRLCPMISDLVFREKFVEATAFPLVIKLRDQLDALSPTAVDDIISA